MSKTNDPFFQGGRYGGKTAMQLEGLSVILNMPKALESRYDANGREVEQGLPPYNPRAAFQVDDYPAAPKEWLRSEPGQLSFMVPVVEEYGMWLDFNHNFVSRLFATHRRDDVDGAADFYVVHFDQNIADLQASVFCRRILDHATDGCGVITLFHLYAEHWPVRIQFHLTPQSAPSFTTLKLFPITLEQRDRHVTILVD